MHGLRGAEAQLAQRIALQNAQDLADDHAAGAGGRRRHDVIAAVVALDRRALAHLVAFEIRLRDDAAAARARRGDGVGDRAPVERVGPVFRDALQRAGEIGLHEPPSRLQRLAVVEEDRGRRRVGAKGLGGAGQHVGIALLEHEAALRETDGGRDDGAARHRAVLRQRQLEARHVARHAGRSIPFGARSLDDVAVAVEVHVGRGGQRGLFAEIDEGLAPVCELERHEAAAAEASRAGKDDAERITDGDRGVDRVATLLQDVDADPGREMLAGDDHAVARADRGLRRRMRMAADEEESEHAKAHGKSVARRSCVVSQESVCQSQTSP